MRIPTGIGMGVRDRNSVPTAALSICEPSPIIRWLTVWVMSCFLSIVEKRILLPKKKQMQDFDQSLSGVLPDPRDGRKPPLPHAFRPSPCFLILQHFRLFASTGDQRLRWNHDVSLAVVLASLDRCISVTFAARATLLESSGRSRTEIDVN